MLWIEVHKFIFFLYSLHGIRATFGSREFFGFWVLFLIVWNSNLLRFLSLDCITANPGRNAFLFPASTQSLVARRATHESHVPIKALGATFMRRHVGVHEAVVSSPIWLFDVSHLFLAILRWHSGVRSTVERNISLVGSVTLICFLIPCGNSFWVSAISGLLLELYLLWWLKIS